MLSKNLQPAMPAGYGHIRYAAGEVMQYLVHAVLLISIVLACAASYPPEVWRRPDGDPFRKGITCPGTREAELLYWRSEPCIDDVCSEELVLRASVPSDEILEIAVVESLTNESSDEPGWYMPALELRIEKAAYSRLAKVDEVTPSAPGSPEAPTVVSYSSKWELVAGGRTHTLPNGFRFDGDKVEFDWFMLDPNRSLEDVERTVREWLACPPAA